MKKIGIAAISAILLLTVSCSKDKMQLKPEPGTNSSAANSSTDRIGVRNDLNNTYQYTAKTSTTIVLPKKFRDDSEPNPDHNSGRVPKKRHIGPLDLNHYQNTGRAVVPGDPGTPVRIDVRNDPNNPYGNPK